MKSIIKKTLITLGVLAITTTTLAIQAKTNTTNEQLKQRQELVTAQHHEQIMKEVNEAKKQREQLAKTQAKKDLKVKDTKPQAVKEGIYNNIEVVSTTSQEILVNVNGDVYSFYGDGFNKGDKITIQMTANKEIVDAYK